MKYLWQLWDSVLDPGIINQIIAECETYNSMEALTGQGSGSQKEKSIRSSEVRWINPKDPKSLFIKDLLWEYVNQANRNAFGVDVNQIFDIQYTKYHATEQGHYDWHFDTFWANDSMWDRKLSITIQLSDPKEYEGGEFIIDPQYEQPNPDVLKSKGTIFVFPSPIRHKVTPVTKGTRKSLVAWVEGPKWK